MRKRQLYNVIEGGSRGHALGRLFDGLLIVIILLSVTVALLGTDGSILAAHSDLFLLLEALCGAIFVLEYVARIWVCTEDRRGRYRHPVSGRIRYMLTPGAVIDLLAILPPLVAASPMVTMDQLWVLRTVRILKLLRYSSAIETLSAVVSNERRPLLASGALMISLLVFLSSLAYAVEKDAQPDKFGSVPAAMWWGIVTLATVGYGDVVPVTPIGRILGGFAVVLGMGMFALPAGILANGFAEEMRRRNFVVTWNLVASVPFFEHLAASRIAEIASVLRSQVAVPGEMLVRKGDPADCMYFIISGDVAVQLPSGPVHLHAGDYFGEIALLTRSMRTATVTATSTCQLLVLWVNDFRKILAAHTDLAETISRVAAERLGAVSASLERQSAP